MTDPPASPSAGRPSDAEGGLGLELDRFLGRADRLAVSRLIDGFQIVTDRLPLVAPGLDGRPEQIRPDRLQGRGLEAILARALGMQRDGGNARSVDDPDLDEQRSRELVVELL